MVNQIEMIPFSDENDSVRNVAVGRYCHEWKRRVIQSGVETQRDPVRRECVRRCHQKQGCKKMQPRYETRKEAITS